ncbi:methyltransferase, FxLD system (plasmid) [Kitasatospora sp. NBC_00070]|uniref:methyltransferase, FxLD system n=1 Tax=Kitasatospora sp. NBC_00070 TaxID=2975962 RepID=UPI002F9185FE
MSLQQDDRETATGAEEFRTAMVAKLRQEGTIRSEAVARAMSVVPRHVFAPEFSLAQAYDPHQALVTRRDANGLATSSVSAPQIQAFMLEQADVQPGMSVEEIGGGGYNAALAAELAGSHGRVVTVDIDPFVTDRSEKFLGEAGYSRVDVVLADGNEPLEDYYGPFDRVIVTVGAWDLPPGWTGQLTEGGTITVPLRMRGITRSITFRQYDDHFVSTSAEVCGFVRMQGSGAHDERLVLLRGKEVGLRFDEDPVPDVSGLDGVLERAKSEQWSAVTVGQAEPFDSLYLWLATSLPGFGMLSVDPELDTKTVTPANRMACPAIADGESLAYLGLRRTTDEVPTYEFGAYGHGPDAERLIDLIGEQIAIWNEKQRGGPGPVFRAYPAGTPDDRLPDGHVIDKRHVRLIISWP